MLKRLIVLNCILSFIHVSNARADLLGDMMTTKLSFAKKVDDPHHVGEKYILNKGQDGTGLTEYRTNYISEPTIVDEGYEYTVKSALGDDPHSQGFKNAHTTRVSAKTCSFPNPNNDFVYHDRLAKESLMIKLYKRCEELGFDGINFVGSTTPGQTTNSRPQLDQTFYTKTATGKLKITMKCYSGDAVCIKDANRINQKEVEETQAALEVCEEDLAAKAGLEVQSNRGLENPIEFVRPNNIKNQNSVDSN